MKRILILLGLFVVCFTADAQRKKNEVLSPEEQAKMELLLADGMKFFVTEEYEKAIAKFNQAAVQFPQNGGVNYALAMAHAKRTDYTSALPYAERAFLQEPDNKYIATLLAEIYTKQQRIDEAIKLYQLLQTRFPLSIEFPIEIAALFIQQQRYDDAMKTYQKIEKQVGINEEITHQKQQLFIRQGKIEEAIREGERLMATDPTDPDLMMEQAELLMTHDRPEQAVAWIERVLVLRPDDADARILLAEVYRKSGNIEKGNQELEKAFADPHLDGQTKAKILTNYLAMLPDDSQYDTVLKFAKTLVEQHPEQARGYLVMGDIALKKNEKATARNSYLKAVRLEKTLIEVWQKVIQLDGDLNQMDSLIAHAEEAVELFPNQAVFWYSSGSAYLIKRKYAKASEALEEAKRLASNPGLLTFINSQLGDAYNGMGKHERSDDAFEEALKTDPNNDHVLNNYGYFLSLRKTNLDRAVALTSHLISRNPENATYLDTHAWVLYMRGEYASARTHLEKAIAINSQSSTYLEHYGDVLFRLGERDLALEQWKKAKILGQTSEQLERKISTGNL